jgi:hypothetical protein
MQLGVRSRASVSIVFYSIIFFSGGVSGFPVPEFIESFEIV